MPKTEIAKISFAKVYALYVAKAEKKGRTRTEVDEVIEWLTGYDADGLQVQIDAGADFETFFADAPRLNPNRSRVTGVICGIRVEEIADPMAQNVRYLDKLIDELARGKAMEKILRA